MAIPLFNSFAADQLFRIHAATCINIDERERERESVCTQPCGHEGHIVGVLFTYSGGLAVSPTVNLVPLERLDELPVPSPALVSLLGSLRRFLAPHASCRARILSHRILFPAMPGKQGLSKAALT